MPSLTSCAIEELLLVVLRPVGLCCMASCCAHHHPPLLVMPHGGCWLVLESAVAGCHLLPIVALLSSCCIVVVCRIALLSFPSTCCRCSRHSCFPILAALIIPRFHPTSSCSWQWLGVLCGGHCHPSPLCSRRVVLCSYGVPKGCGLSLQAVGNIKDG
jgi:hypothetical protein